MVNNIQMSKVKFFIWLIALITTIILIIAYWIHESFHPSTDDAYVEANVVHISSLVSGQVVNLYVKNNKNVKKDERLIDIDPAPFKIAMNAAEAELALAKQNVSASQSAIESAKALVAQRQSELDLATKNANRILKLAECGQVSKSQADETKTKEKVGKAALNAAISQLEQVQKNLGQVGDENGKVSDENAQIKAAQAKFDKATLDLEHTQIKSPVSGQIVNFSLRKGTLATEGYPLFDIVENSKWWIDANFKETQMERIKVGQKASISVDMYPSVKFKGIVESISVGSGSAFSILPPENATGNWVKVTQRIPVKVVILNTIKYLPIRVGSSANVSIDTRS